MSMAIENETTDFVKIASGFKNSSVFRYGKDISLDPVTKSDIKSVDYLEELLMAEKITLSDMYVLEAVAFFGHADLRMVACRLKRMAEQYPHKPVITDSDSLSSRLQTLGKYGLLWRRKYSCGGKGNIFVYTITYRGFKMYSERLDKSFHYDTGLVAQCTTKVLRSIHVGEVACIFEGRLSKVAEIEEWRHSSYALGYGEKGRFYPNGYIRCLHNGDYWNIILEAAHFNVDDRIESERERVLKFEEKLGTLIKVKDAFAAKYENTIFVFCVEDFDGVNRLSKILAGFKEDFNGNTYVTSERVLKTNRLDFASSMVKPRIIGSDLKVTACIPSQEWFIA